MACFEVLEIRGGDAVVDVAVRLVAVAVITNFTGTKCVTWKDPLGSKSRVDKALLKMLANVSWYVPLVALPDSSSATKYTCSAMSSAATTSQSTCQYVIELASSLAVNIRRD